MIMQVLTDTMPLDAEAEKWQNEIAVVTELIRQCVDENSRVGLDKAEYLKRYSGLASSYEKAMARVKKIEGVRHARRVMHEQIEVFLETLILNNVVLTEFDEMLWYAVIDKVTVHSYNEIEFTFKDGTVVKV